MAIVAVWYIVNNRKPLKTKYEPCHIRVGKVNRRVAHIIHPISASGNYNKYAHYANSEAVFYEFIHL